MENNILPPEPPPNIEYNLNDYIAVLPPDLKTHIYKQHLWFDVEKKHICNEILDWFNSTEASCLKYNDEIANKLSCLLNCKTSIEYLRKNDKEFDKCYIDHYIRNQKYFELMSIFESFILSILMHKYH